MRHFALFVLGWRQEYGNADHGLTGIARDAQIAFQQKNLITKVVRWDDDAESLAREALSYRNGDVKVAIITHSWGANLGLGVAREIKKLDSDVNVQVVTVDAVYRPSWISVHLYLTRILGALYSVARWIYPATLWVPPNVSRCDVYRQEEGHPKGLVPVAEYPSRTKIGGGPTVRVDGLVKGYGHNEIDNAPEVKSGVLQFLKSFVGGGDAMDRSRSAGWCDDGNGGGA